MIWSRYPNETGAPGGWPNDLYPPGSQGASQFSTSSPGTLGNSPALSVTRASPATTHGGDQEIVRTGQRAGSLQCRSHLGILLIGAFFVRRGSHVYHPIVTEIELGLMFPARKSPLSWAGVTGEDFDEPGTHPDT
jgi:hypothetical protein